MMVHIKVDLENLEVVCVDIVSLQRSQLTCKVRSYDIACNSCSSWNENEPKYTKGQISEANIKHGHKIIKQSVQLNILNLHLSN